MRKIKNYEYVEVYYDGECGMCRQFASWLKNQPHYYVVKLLPYQSKEAAAIFPELKRYHPEKQMVVRTSTKEVFQGAQSWVICLHACKDHRAKALKMRSPLLMPLAAKLCKVMATHRYKISKLFFQRTEQEVAQDMEKLHPRKCKDDGCKTY